MSTRAWAAGAAFFLAAVTLFAPEAKAIPAFSKKYEAPCDLCHTSWSRLNETGAIFKINGYQLRGAGGKDETARRTLEGGYSFDIGSANPPFSLMASTGYLIAQPKEGPDGLQGDSIPCCGLPTTGKIVAAGTAGRDVGYMLSLLSDGEGVDEAYLRINNLFGDGVANFDLGRMGIFGYDVISPSRNFFSVPSPVYHGHPYNPSDAVLSSSANRRDIGMRVYGRPGYAPFSYEIALYTGDESFTGVAEDQSGIAYTVMARVDKGPFAASARYWLNDTANTDITVGDTLFAADPLSPDEHTTQISIGASYRTPFLVIDLALDSTVWALDDRKSADGATLIHDDVTRLAFSADATWIATNWLSSGLSVYTATHEGYSYTSRGTTHTVEAFTAGLLEWRIDFLPSSNIRLGVALQYDITDEVARQKNDGTGAYEGQNKAFITLDLIL